MSDDYSFMKSGFSNIEPDDINDQNYILKVMALICVFTENSLNDADTYVQHAQRDIILTKDINLCLKVEVFKFLERENTEIQMKEWFDLLNNDSETQEKSEYECEDEDLVEDTNIIFTYSECNCDLCMNINKIEKKWKKWIPKNDIEMILKKSIDIRYD